MSQDKPRIRVVSAEIKRDGRYLITKRPSHAVLPGLWEFPGGRVREGETDEDALCRSLQGRIGCAGDVGGCLMEVEQTYDSYDLVLAVYSVDLGEAEPVPGSVEALDWVDPDGLTEREFPGADQQTIDLLLSEGK